MHRALISPLHYPARQIFLDRNRLAVDIEPQIYERKSATTDAAIDQAWHWWPNAAVPSQLLGELATPAEFEAIAEAVGPAPIGETVVCTSDVAPVVEAIDRFVAAGFDTVHLHQVGPDQQRLFDMMASDLLPHYA